MRAQSRGDGDACPAQRGTSGFLSGPLKAAHPPTSKTRMASQDEHYCAETLVIIQDCANLLVAERACSQSRQRCAGHAWVRLRRPARTRSTGSSRQLGRNACFEIVTDVSVYPCASKRHTACDHGSTRCCFSSWVLGIGWGQELSSGFGGPQRL